MPTPVILCVDDERIVLGGIKQELEDEFGGRYSIEVAESAAEALELMAELFTQGVDVPVVISDQLMPGMKGDELLTQVHELNPRVRTVLLTGQASADAVGRALNQANLYRFLSKPWETQDLCLTVGQAATSYYQELELAHRHELLQRLQQAQAALAATVSLPALEQALLKNLLLHLGGTRALLLRLDQSPGQSHVLSCLEAGRQGESVHSERLGGAEPWPARAPRTLIESRLRQPEPLVVTAAETAPASADPYLADLRGTGVCWPLVKAGKMLAVVWLELSETELTAPKREYLELLMPQAAVLIDNALFLLDLEERIRERTAVLEAKNADLADSLRYAHRIQLAIFPDVKPVEELVADQFLLHLSTHEVSGAFCWSWQAADELLLVVGDAAGAGVPAAFLSVLTHSVLRRLVSEQGQRTPLALLRALERQIAQRLGGIAEPQGVGLAVAHLSKQMHGWQAQVAATAAGAIVVRGDEVEVVPTAAGELGLGHVGNALPITETALAPGDRLYLYTLGLTRQPGEIAEGADGWGLPRWRQWLADHGALELNQQKAKLHASIAGWRGQQPQIDDVLVWAVEA